MDKKIWSLRASIHFHLTWSDLVTSYFYWSNALIGPNTHVLSPIGPLALWAGRTRELKHLSWGKAPKPWSIFLPATLAIKWATVVNNICSASPHVCARSQFGFQPGTCPAELSWRTVWQGGFQLVALWRLVKGDDEPASLNHPWMWGNVRDSAAVKPVQKANGVMSASFALGRSLPK